MEYRICKYDEILPLKGRDSKFCGFQYKDDAVYIGCFLNEKIIGCCGYILRGNRLEYVNAVVDKDFRGKGIYSNLYSMREKLVSTIEHKMKYAYCTEMSIKKLLKEGFKIVKRYKSTFKVVKE